MSVQFNEENGMPRRRAASRDSYLTRLVLKTGLAKTPEGAERVLLIIGVVSLLAAIVIFFDLGSLIGL